MDNLQTLFDKKQYELIVELTDSSDDPKERLMRLSSLVMLNRVNEALDEIENHQDMYDKNYPKKVMHLHFELLFQSKLYDDARLALKHYKDLPYISQEVEEYLNGMDMVINEKEHEKDRHLPLDVINERFEKETDKELLYEAISYIRMYNLNAIIDSLKVLLKREDIDQDVRAVVLFALMEQNYPEVIEYRSRRGIERIVPKEMKTPFEDGRFNDTVTRIAEYSDRNTTIKDTALTLLMTYICRTFPEDIYGDGIDNIAEAIVSIAKEYVCEKDEILGDEIVALKDKIRPIVK